MANFTNGTRVEWREGGSQFRCTGTVITSISERDGSNPLGWHEIRVDDEHVPRACHTAREMNLGWVCRAVLLNGLQAEVL